MKYFLQLLLLIIIAGFVYGFYIKSENPESGHFFIGLSVAVLFFVLMPLFIYHRWKNKDVKNYMLTKENIEKMRDYNQGKKL